MERMIAYCGLVCTDCPAYVATKANDWAELEKVAAQWREEYGAPVITVDSVRCDGCVADNGYKCGYCSECAVRACGQRRSVRTCAHCSDYPCQRLKTFFDKVPEAKTTLESLRVQRVASRVHPL